MHRILLIAVLLTVWGSPGLATQTASAHPAPSMSLVDLDGKTHTLEQYRGKWVVINYWATWCPPCIEELPSLALFHEAHKDSDAVVLGINKEEISDDDLDDFLEDFLIGYPLFKESPYKPTPFGQVRAMPTTVLIDPQGEIATLHEGGVTREALEDFMKRYEALKAAKATQANKAE